MAKIINIDGSVKDWIHENSHLIRLEILKRCEEALLYEDESVELFTIKTSSGLSKFYLDTLDKIIVSLKLAMENFSYSEE